jgi:hypothetical protein
MRSLSRSLEFSGNTPAARRLRMTAVCLAAWIGVALLFSVQRLVGIALGRTEPAWESLALDAFIPWGGWALLTPLIAFLVRRLPLSSHYPRRLLLHVPLGIAVGVMHSLIVATITPLFLWRPSFLPIRDIFAGRLASTIAIETLIYLMVAAALYAWAYASEAQRQGADRQRLVLQLAEIRNQNSDTEFIAVPVRDGVLRLPIHSIEWVQAEDNYVRLHAGRQSHLLRMTLNDLERKLASRDFVRVHRSTMVRVGNVARLSRTRANGYTVVLDSGVQLRVSKRHWRNVETLIQAPLTP